MSFLRAALLASQGVEPVEPNENFVEEVKAAAGVLPAWAPLPCESRPRIQGCAAREGCTGQTVDFSRHGGSRAVRQR